MSPFQRTGHKVKRNHSNASPRYIIAIHVEASREPINASSTRFYRKFRQASIVIGRLVVDHIEGTKVLSFDSPVPLWESICEYSRPNYTTWIVGNKVLPQLIWCRFPELFERSEIHIDRPRSKRCPENNDADETLSAALAVLEAPPTILGCRVARTQGRLVVVDILNWFRGELPANNTAEESPPTADDIAGYTSDQLREYGQRQAQRVHQTFTELVGWVRKNDMGLFRYTASSQAMGAYRHRFMEHPIYVHDNRSVQECERQALFGGRSEVFRRGEISETVYQLDCNSLFPSVMAGCHFPYILGRYHQRADYIPWLPKIDWSASVAEVVLNTDQPLYPARTDMHVIYPVGEFTTSLCGNELYRAFRAGIIKAVRCWSEYKMAPLFRLWVNELYEMRQGYKREGNERYDAFAKLLLNSLYGKFAQLTPNWVPCLDEMSLLPFTTDTRRDPGTGEWISYRAVGWQVQQLQARTTREGSFYAIAAFVTSAARARMDYLRNIAGADSVYYQGVDSLIVSSKGYRRLAAANELSETELGKMKLAYTADHGNIHGISDYMLGSKQVISSRALHSEVTTLGDVVQHRYYVMDHLFRHGPVDYIEEKVEEWNRTNGYPKGEVGPDGWVSPLVLGNTPKSSSDGSGTPATASAAS